MTVNKTHVELNHFYFQLELKEGTEMSQMVL